MPNDKIHPDWCRCPGCQPPAPELAPSLRAFLIGAAALVLWAGVIWIASAAANFVAALFSCLN